MATMRVMQVSEPGAALELAEREIPEPGPGEVRVRVQACGICHSDAMVKDGHFPGVPFPIVPGHEVAGVLDALGDGVHGWETGERVGVGWYGGSCGNCARCRRGDLMFCENMPIPGVTMDGGYADYVVCRAAALAHMPDDLAPAAAGPLMCAGVTTFNAIRTAAPPAGSLLAILGIGGLGHLGVQFAARLGFETVAIARGEEKRELALGLGAHHYIDSTAEDPGEALTALGGASLILATVTNSAAMAAALGGLGLHGRFVVV
ncbi:MAG TPA: alcohol dehydrogenase catalytic domain-containing protein, partial [Solirubrobacteraceae bacterium]|nr:alcohol dehydrogenase catalytic domain-containing protein [Solirubrobacteraceae bacterium]